MEQAKYEIDIFWSDEDGGYIASVPDLKYCSAFGQTYEEALREVRVARDLHLSVLKELGRPIPEPRTRKHADAEILVKKLNEAAERFTDALVKQLGVGSGRAVEAQDQGARLTEDFFNRVVENLRTQANSNREMAQQLADQQLRAAESAQQLTQESVNAYMDFVNSMFTFGQQGAQVAQRGAEEAPPRG